MLPFKENGSLLDASTAVDCRDHGSRKWSCPHVHHRGWLPRESSVATGLLRALTGFPDSQFIFTLDIQVHAVSPQPGAAGFL